MRTRGRRACFTAGQTFPKPATLYGITKLAGEQAALQLGDVLGLDVRAVRLTPVPARGSARPAWRHHEPAVANSRARGGRPPCHPTATDPHGLALCAQHRAAGIAAVLGATGMRQRVVDLGGGAAFDVLQWADAIGKHHPNVVCRLAGPGETPNVGYFLARDRAPLDTTAIARETGFRPRYNLQSAAADYAEWLSRPASNGAFTASGRG